jgi:hypothetical protein
MARSASVRLALGGDGVEAPTQHDVHHALIGGVAVFERDLFRQDVDAQNRLGGDVLDLRETGNAMAVEQNHRRLAAPPAVAARLRRQLFQQFGDGADAIGPNVGGAELDLRLDVPNDRAR